MKKLLIVLFTLALATSAFAQKKATANYEGIVDKYDTATKTLTIKKGDKQGEFVITDTSEVTKDKAKADASAIAAGQKVKVEFWLEGSKKVVKKVEVSGGTAVTK
jgi:hypothetical protein